MSRETTPAAAADPEAGPPAIQDAYPEETRHCYGCGARNERGYRLRSYRSGNETVCRFTPEPHHTSLPGFVYGGLIASLVDCHGTGSAAEAAYRAAGRPLGSDPPLRFVTASLRVDFRRPTPLGEELLLRGRAVEVAERKVRVAVTVEADGVVTVEGEVLAVRLPDDWPRDANATPPSAPLRASSRSDTYASPDSGVERPTMQTEGPLNEPRSRPRREHPSETEQRPMSDYAVILQRLVETAKAEQTVTYSDLGALIGLDMGQPDQRQRLSNLLGEINTAEHHHGRPMLSAVAVLKGEGRPGQGFFEICHRLGVYSGDKDSRVQDEFFVAELRRVHNYWAK